MIFPSIRKEKDSVSKCIISSVYSRVGEIVITSGIKFRILPPLRGSPGRLIFYESHSNKRYPDRRGGVPSGAATFISSGGMEASASIVYSARTWVN